MSEKVEKKVDDPSMYKGFRVLGDRLLVRVIEPPKVSASGLIVFPDNSSLRPPVVEVMAKGKGKITKTVHKRHYYPGSKKWGKAGHEIPIKGHGKDTEDINVGDFCITSHPYLKSDVFTVGDEDVRLHLIQSYEVVATIELEEGDSEEAFGQIEMKQISVGG